MKSPPQLPKLRATPARPDERPRLPPLGRESIASIQPAQRQPSLTPSTKAVSARDSQGLAAGGRIEHWRYAPTLRCPIPESPAVKRRRALATLLACAAGAAGVLLLSMALRPTSSRAGVTPKPGSAEILELARLPVARAAAIAHGPTGAAGTPASELAPHDARPSAPSRDTADKPRSGSKRSVPHRNDVREALNKVAPSVSACLGPSDVARVNLTFAGASGRVIRTKVLGGVNRKAVGCVAHAARKAEVPPFKKSKFVVRHTFEG